ncbi:hypothetical protein ACFQ9X_29665 [Catenulispora yoronensis]
MPSLKAVLTDSAALDAYRNDPFNPYAIARLRPVAFQKAVVMQFVDNLIDWGDSLFAQDTTESINEATMLYVLASEILGAAGRARRLRGGPGGGADLREDRARADRRVGLPGHVGELLVSELAGPGGATYHGSASLLKAEAAAAASAAPAASVAATASDVATAPAAAVPRPTAATASLLPYAYASDLVDQHRSLASLWKVLPYHVPPATQIVTQTDLVFCVPPDEVQLGYWDKVEDRLTKIRNCLNLSGVRRQLALFAPPINPMDLVRARAAGLSIEEAVAAAGAPSAPAYRFTALIDRARQSAQTVASFGARCWRRWRRRTPRS